MGIGRTEWIKVQSEESVHLVGVTVCLVRKREEPSPREAEGGWVEVHPRR